MKNKVFTSDIRTVFAIGDLHGDYESFHKILRVHEESGKGSLLLFLGDYSDRGHYGFEIITKLNRLMDSTDNIVALKGNHERYINGKPIFHPCRLIQ